MKVVFTSAALSDLNDLLAHTSTNYPGLVHAVELRIRAVIERLERWPESARRVEGRSGIRVVPIIRYPYKVFYRITGDGIEILHIHHTSRDAPSD